jgi:hypothetical protein
LTFTETAETVQGFVLLWRNVVPKRVQKRVCCASLEQDRDDGTVAASVGVDQVSNHVEPLAVNVLLARMVEVKLFEGINLVANCQCAAWRVIDHDGVAIVDDAERDRIVIELELGKIRKIGVGNVDGRLLMSHFATGEGWIERTPMFWVVLAFVSPVRLVRLLSARDGGSECESKCHGKTAGLH